MSKYISFMRLTEKGQAMPPDKIAETYKQMIELAESFGGKVLEIWTGTHDVDFVTITEFPNDEAAFKARIKLNQLGLIRLETAPTYPIEAYLAAATEKRVPVTV